MFRSRNRTRAMDGLPGGAAYWYRQVKNVFVSGGYDGFILDAGDISTLNQVSTGTTPVTAVTQPMGLMLDKHLGMQLGPELASAAYTTPATYDNITTTISAASFNQIAGTTLSRSYINIPTTVGKGYWITFKVDSINDTYTVYARNAYAGVGTIIATSSIVAATTYTLFFVATTTTSSILWSSTVVSKSISASAISVKLLDGNHALQSTAAARPTWQVDANGHHYAQFLGTDDSLSCATGGGGSTGFLFCAALKPTGGAGTARRLFSDESGVTGYAVGLTTADTLTIRAGNGSAITSKETTGTVAVGTANYVTAIDNGTTISAQIDAGAIASVARPVVVAGTAGYTLFKTNGTASNFFIGDFYRAVYIKNWAGTAAQLSAIQAWVKAGAGL